MGNGHKAETNVGWLRCWPALHCGGAADLRWPFAFEAQRKIRSFAVSDDARAPMNPSQLQKVRSRNDGRALVVLGHVLSSDQPSLLLNLGQVFDRSIAATDEEPYH